jgi:ribose transport system ATP-binding protein
VDLVDSSDDVLRVTGVRRSFGATVALGGVDLAVRAGEIHALVGGNGSGKSTLLKILAGVLPADEGTLTLGGRTWNLSSFDARDSRMCGLRFVHQQPTVFPNLSVMDNLCVGGSFTVGPARRIRWRSTRARVRDVLARFGIDAAPDDVLGSLSPAKRTMVEIARALQDLDQEGPSVLALDEPTAALPHKEVDLLLPMLQRFASESGQAILFVSHRLDEIVQIANRVTVLRDGRSVTTLEHDQVNKSTLVEAIVGRPLDTYFPDPVTLHEHATPVMRAHGLSGGVVQGLDLEVGAGEVVGLAGPMGSGRSTVLKLIYGAMQAKGGTLELGGQAMSLHDPEEAIAAGIGYVPEDRIGHAVLPGLSIADNLAVVDARSYWRGYQQRRRELADAAEAIGRFGIKASSPSAPMTSLSGGNQQKVVLARWLSRPTRLLLLDEPTQAVDVGARADLWRLIHEASESGVGIVIASSDLEELAHLCERVIIMRDGHAAAELAGPQAVTEEEIGRVMMELEAA